jgi:tetratricopeptide (TPR) repeat protein
VIALRSAGVPDTNLSVVITEILPENVNFLSLFVIGHLEYLSNNYQLGYRAFDAAMAQIPPPEKATIQNQAILHFFRARQMEHDGSAPEDVICEYAKALEVDPQFDVANNNLGLVISKSIAEGNSVGNLSFMEASRPCLERAGLHEDFLELPPLLFERAANANPNFLIAKYNQHAYLWSRDWDYQNDPQLKLVMEDIQRQDPSIIGPYIILAVSKDRQGDPAGAIQMYQAGIAVEPDLAFFM